MAKKLPKILEEGRRNYTTSAMREAVIKALRAYGITEFHRIELDPATTDQPYGLVWRTRERVS